MIEKVEGIVLKETAYGETSKIIQVLSREHGLISIIGHGAQKLKSPLRSGTLKSTYGYFNLYYKKDKLSDLIAVDVIDSFDYIKANLKLISYLSFLLDLTYQVANQTNDLGLFPILLEVTKKIDAGFEPLILTNILELKYLPFLGLELNLEGCVLCGDTKNIVTISEDEGGLICQKCYRGQRIIDAKILKLIRKYYLIDLKNLKELRISLSVQQEIDAFIDNYYDKYSGLYLKSKEFLKKMIES